MSVVINLAFVVLLLCAYSDVVHAQGGRLAGRIVRTSDNSPLPGASIKVQGSKIGAYANRKGEFQLVVPELPAVLVVRSVGSHERKIEMKDYDSTLVIGLTDAPLTAHDVQVIGEINVNEVVRRAISRRDENRRKVWRYSMELFVRQVKDERTTLFGKETVHPEYQQYVKRYDMITDSNGVRGKGTVLERQQSRSTTERNRVSFGLPFDDFDSDTLRLDSLFGSERFAIVRPLAKTAMDIYEYRMRERRMYGSKYVYVIEFEPRSRLNPAFEGVMHIIEDSYDVVGALYRFTKETAIPFVDSVLIDQRYEEVTDGIWMPSMTSFTALAKISGLFGAVSAELEFAGYATVLRYQLNASAPDSLFNWGVPDSLVVGITTVRNTALVPAGKAARDVRGNIVYVNRDADTQEVGQWDSLGVQPPTEAEKRLMATSDTTAPRRTRAYDGDSSRSSEFRLFSLRLGPVGAHFSPVLTRTTITGFLYGGRVVAELDSLSLALDAAFSAARSPIATVSISYRLPLFARVSTSASLYATRTAAMIHTPPASQGALQRASMFVYGTSRDFFAAEGYGGAFLISGRSLGVHAGIEALHHKVGMPVVELNRPIPITDEGHFTVGRLRFSSVDSSLASLIGGIQKVPLVGSLELGAAAKSGESDLHSWVLADASLQLPTFATGYEDMSIRLAGRARIASNTTPGQFLFYSTPRFAFAGDANDMLTIPLNVFAGNRQYQVMVEHNFSDYVWRACGLPLYNRRGLDLILSYAAARFEHGGVPVAHGMMQTNGWYQEMGVGIDRIPTFLFDYLNLRFEMRTPVGNHRPSGSAIGWTLGITSLLI